MSDRLKAILVSRLPFLIPLWKQVKYFTLKDKPSKQIFSEIYHKNKWGSMDTPSGPGSDLVQTAVVRKVLPQLLDELNIKSLLDIPCGDFYWMKLVKMDVEYIGGDIVDELIKDNQMKYGSASRRFVNLDLQQDELPKVDLIFCRDCLVHFSYQHIQHALGNIKSSRCEYLLTTTFTGRESNIDIPTGAWRPINLQIPPFNFPEPTRLIDEECPLDSYRDKCLGLWKMSDIPDF